MSTNLVIHASNSYELAIIFLHQQFLFFFLIIFLFYRLAIICVATYFYCMTQTNIACIRITFPSDVTNGSLFDYASQIKISMDQWTLLSDFWFTSLLPVPIHWSFRHHIIIFFAVQFLCGCKFTKSKGRLVLFSAYKAEIHLYIFDAVQYSTSIISLSRLLVKKNTI